MHFNTLLTVYVIIIVCAFLYSGACTNLLIADEGPQTKISDSICLMLLCYDKLANLIFMCKRVHHILDSANSLFAMPQILSMNVELGRLLRC